MFSKKAEKLLQKRYLLKNDEGEVIETPDEMFRRVASFIANNKQEEKDFYKILSNLDFLPSSPILFNAGTDHPMMFACYVSPVEDSIEGIFSALTYASKIFQKGGGVGYDFSKLRPKGSLIKSSKGKSSGPVSFMKIFNTMTEVVKAGGRRKGAQIAVLRVDHPDIEEFITCKKTEGEMNNFNISVGITDEFMQAVKDNGYYQLKHPAIKNGSRRKARKIWDMIVEHAWGNGEPGLLFLDTINRGHSLPDEVSATNPCFTGDTLVAVADGRGAVPFKQLAEEGRDVPVYTRNDDGETTIRMMRNPRRTRTNAKIMKITLQNGHVIRCTPDHKIRLKNGEFTEAQYLKKRDELLCMTNFRGKVAYVEHDGMEDVYDGTVDDFHNFYVGHFPGKTQSGKKRFGYVNVHNCSEAILRPFESCDLGSINLTHMIKDGDIYWDKLRETVHLGVRFLDNVIDKNEYILPEIEKAVKESRKIGLGVMGWADNLIMLGIKYDSKEGFDLGEKLAKFLYDEAEKASIQLAEEKGPFPLFKKSRLKKKRRNASLLSIAPTGSISLLAGVSSGIEPVFSTSYVHTDQEGDQIVIEKDLYKKNPEIVCTAKDISYKDHLRMQVAFQKHVDQGISKTISLPKDATKKDVANAYIFAWESGCKGITVYREGSRQKEVLVDSTRIQESFERSKAQILDGRTAKIKTGCGSLYVTLNYYRNNPVELFARLGRSGGCASCQSEAVGRLISLALRSGIGIEDIVRQMKGISCDKPIGIGRGKIFSCVDGIAKAMEKIQKISIESEIDSSRTCPSCGAPIVPDGKCSFCPSCGYSHCS